MTSSNSYRQQQRNLIEFFNLAKSAIESIPELNFADTPVTYSGQLPYAYIDYPEQEINIVAHNLVNQRLSQRATVNLNVHVFVKADKPGDAAVFVEKIADYIYQEHPFDGSIVPIIEPDGTHHFTLQVKG